MENERKRKCPAVSWVKRGGAGAFIFFLIKGLLWLLVPTFVVYLSRQ
jgi:hypothetical protein